MKLLSALLSTVIALAPTVTLAADYKVRFSKGKFCGDYVLTNVEAGSTISFRATKGQVASVFYNGWQDDPIDYPIGRTGLIRIPLNEAYQDRVVFKLCIHQPY